MKRSEWELLENQWDAEGMILDEELAENSVLYEKDLEIAAAYITFNVPERLNALTEMSMERVGDLVREAEVDDDVKTIIFRGNGPCFGTGADARELGHYIGYRTPKPGEPKPKIPSQRQRILPDRNLVMGVFTATVANCLKATICQVHSYCYGGHMQIALVSDMIIATPDAQFTHPAFRYLGAGPQDMFMWIENLGLKKMKEIMLTMRPLRAAEAEQAGFVNRIVEEDELAEVTREYARAISMMPLDGIMIGKSMMRLAMEARGKGVGEMCGWVGHGWATNLQFADNDYNFLKERHRKGLTQALHDRDEAVAPYFRLGGHHRGNEA